MKIGTTIHVGSFAVTNNQDGSQFKGFLFKKVDIRNYNSLLIPLPAAAVIINGFNFPSMGLVDIKSNPNNWNWGTVGALANFVNNEHWAVSNSRNHVKSIGILRRTIRGVNFVRKSVGLNPFKHKLSLWLLCNASDGTVLPDSFFSTLNSTTPNKPIKLSTYSSALPLP